LLLSLSLVHNKTNGQFVTLVILYLPDFTITSFKAASVNARALPTMNPCFLVLAMLLQAEMGLSTQLQGVKVGQATAK
jgi:hypothetical protein